MTDPLGLISQASGLARDATPAARSPQAVSGPSFKDLLRDQIKQVNDLQQDVKEATEDLVTGRRDDIENVLAANEKADLAFKLLLQVRNKVMDAYEDVKQIRV